jgi:hypothetical protein
MMDARAIFNMPLVNIKKTNGVSYQMIVHCNDSGKSDIDAQVTKRIPNLIFKASAARNDLIFGFNSTNIAEGGEILKWAKKLPGVGLVRMNIVENVVHVFDWLEKEIDLRAGEAA